MSIDKVFEALSSAPRRRILAYLSKTDMTAGGQIGGREAPGERTPETRVEDDPSTVRRVRPDGGIAPQ